MTLSVPSGVFTKYQEACDWFINDSHIGQICTLIYPPKKIVCSNCTSLTGSSTSNVYRHGGPAPFRFGNCPLCGGNGYSEQEVTGSLRMRVYFSRKDWIRISGSSSIVTNNADAMGIGFLSDLSNLQKAIEIILVKDEINTKFRSKLLGSPQPHGFGKNRYFIAFFEAV